MNILIAVPSMDMVPAVFTQSLAMLEKQGNCAVAFEIGSLIYYSRNNLARKALEMNADYVFWLDSDMVFPSDTLIRMFELLEKHNLDMLAGVYHRRVAPYKPIAFDKCDITPEGICEWTEFDEMPSDEVFEIGACGFGCVLMKSQILFDTLAKFGDMFSPIGMVGEDLSFCWRARQVGYKIHATEAINLGHYSHTIVTKQFYDAYRKGKDNA